MESEVKTMTLRERAAQEYAEEIVEQQERERKAAAHNAELEAKALEEHLGYIGVTVEAQNGSVTVDGITFRIVNHYDGYMYDWDLQVLMPYPCWGCGVEVWERISSLADVHRKFAAAEDNPVECDECHRRHLKPAKPADVPAPPTPLERLGQAMADYLNYLEQEAH